MLSNPSAAPVVCQCDDLGSQQLDNRHAVQDPTRPDLEASGVCVMSGVSAEWDGFEGLIFWREQMDATTYFIFEQVGPPFSKFIFLLLLNATVLFFRTVVFFIF